MQTHGVKLVEGGLDVIQGVIAAVDGEKDPRCLLLSFQLSQQVVKTYEEQPSVCLPSCNAIHHCFACAFLSKLCMKAVWRSHALNLFSLICLEVSATL